MMGTTSKPTAEERKERKRLQNRINQRARRQRLRDQSGTHSQRGPYQVNRWRLDEGPALPEPSPKAPAPSLKYPPSSKPGLYHQFHLSSAQYSSAQ
ncbi:hypothetical protein CDV31_016165 [Fusarium ambrosium]|uniref:BZIP domain-containing protein n=1 Tax=Fusarium ambrosium TaxID=131363 RepID=A0A428SDY5_9HYPO|nr:hypothetical protein CDV31_016165 [Fusarium ambrosium]